MKHILTIIPAITPIQRHALEKFLDENSDYNVIGGGTTTDGSECDITFESSSASDNSQRGESGSSAS